MMLNLARIIILSSLFFPLAAHAVGGQFWDIKPPKVFNKNTLIQANCANYRGDIETIIGLDDGTLFLGGNLCGKPFNLYEAINAVNDIGLEAGTAITLCLSDGKVSGLDCMAYNDPSLVTTVFSDSFFGALLSDPVLIQKRQQREDAQAFIADLEKKSIPSRQLSAHLDSIQQTARQLNIEISGDSSRLLGQLRDKVAENQTTVENKTVESKVAESKKIESSAVEAKAAAPAGRFLSALARGSSGDDVRQLQEFLAGDKELYPEGLATGYFGPLTEQAVQRFQKKHGIVSSGDPESTGYGRVGPRTMRKLNELIGTP